MPRLSFASRLYSFVGNAVIGFPPADPRLEHMYLLPAERVRANGPLREDNVDWLHERLEGSYLMRQMTKRIGPLVSIYVAAIMCLCLLVIAPFTDKLMASRHQAAVVSQQADEVAQQKDQQAAQASESEQKHASFCQQTRAINLKYPNSATPLPSFCGPTDATAIPKFTNHE